MKREQVVAIQHLIAAAVPQLEPNQISIIDDRGNLLARGLGTGGDANSQANADEKKLAYEQRTTRVIEDLLSRSLGFGKVRAEVTADLDFDRITTSSEIFDPESQVIRSTQTVEDNNESTDRDALDPVTVASWCRPATPIRAPRAHYARPRAPGPKRRSTTRSARRSKATSGSGKVRRLSVAVLVDGMYTPNPDGAPHYAPRSKEEMAQIEALVRSAIGFDAVRGDLIEVINMRFATPDAEFADGSEAIFLGMAKEDLFRIAEMVVLAIVAILVILLVIRPLMARAFERNDGTGEEEAERLLTDQSGSQTQLTGRALSPRIWRWKTPRRARNWSR